MWKVLTARLHQGQRTMKYPDGPAPEMPDRFAGAPEVDAARCPADCHACAEACPNGALSRDAASGLRIDLGLCLFCRACEGACPHGAIRYASEYRLAAARREDLVVRSGQAGQAAQPGRTFPAEARNALAQKLLSKSLCLRQVSAGGCGACEADANVLSTVAWDMGRFGISFVASPRHADGLLVTGPVTENMRLALLKTYEAVPAPKIVIASGACAVAGGPYAGHPEVHNGIGSLLPVDLYIPGCPPHPLTILDGLLRFLGRID